MTPHGRVSRLARMHAHGHTAVARSPPATSCQRCRPIAGHLPSRRPCAPPRASLSLAAVVQDKAKLVFSSSCLPREAAACASAVLAAATGTELCHCATSWVSYRLAPTLLLCASMSQSPAWSLHRRAAPGFILRHGSLTTDSKPLTKSGFCSSSTSTRATLGASPTKPTSSSTACPNHHRRHTSPIRRHRC
jgi:hypothetical protein